MVRIGTKTIIAVLAAILCNSACTSFGPRTIPRDRIDYLDSIGESWKRQTLMNILRLRYMDTPMFLDVSSVVASYELGTSVAANANVNTTGSPAVPQVGVSGSGNWSSSPTISYVPLTGSKFLQSLIEAVPPLSVLYLVEVGYPADFVLELGVESVNGVRNRSDHAGDARLADPEFLRLAVLLRKIQEQGGIGLRIQEAADKRRDVLLLFHPERLTKEGLDQVSELKKLLGLAEDKNEFKVISSPVRGQPDELAVNSRSIMQMMAALATFVEIPEADIAEGAATPAPSTTQWAQPLLRVRSGAAPPSTAFVAVVYQNHWFWIDNRDWRSKRTLSTVLFLFTLTDTDVSGRLPVLTIPVK